MFCSTLSVAVPRSFAGASIRISAVSVPSETTWSRNSRCQRSVLIRIVIRLSLESPRIASSVARIRTSSGGSAG